MKNKLIAKILAALLIMLVSTSLTGCDADMEESTSTFDPWTTRYVTTRASVSTGR